MITRAQLLTAGFSADSVDHRVRAQWLRPLHRGVYAVGPVTPPNAREMAAVLACGDRAVISHHSAAQLWHLLPYPPDRLPVDVTVPSHRRTQRPGVRVHRTRILQGGETTKVKGIPITTPARTLLDLAATTTSRELEQAMAEAERRRLAGHTDLAVLLARYPRRPGARAVRALLEADRRPALTRSQAEERLLDLLRKARLPAPDVNARLGAYEVDFLWRGAGLIVEVDGFAFHADRAAFEADRRRDAELAARGHTVIRVTWRQIADEPEAVLVRLGQALARRVGA